MFVFSISDDHIAVRYLGIFIHQNASHHHQGDTFRFSKYKKRFPLPCIIVYDRYLY